MTIITRIRVAQNKEKRKLAVDYRVNGKTIKPRKTRTTDEKNEKKQKADGRRWT